MPIKVLLADDHRLFREGLRKLLEFEKDITVIGEAADGLSATEMARQLEPDVVLMDINMPLVDGLAATKTILEERPGTGIIILTMYEEESHVRLGIGAGAVGYILKTAALEDVAAAVRAAAKGASSLDPSVTTKVLNEFRRLVQQDTTRSTLKDLTEKEVEVLRLIGNGHSNKEIAIELNYSESTVKNRLSVLFEKIGARDRTQAAIFAITNGLISSGKPSEIGLVS